MTEKPRTFETVAELHDIAAGLYTTNALRGRQLSVVADRIHTDLTEKDCRIEELQAQIDAGLRIVELMEPESAAVPPGWRLIHDELLVALNAERKAGT